MCNKKSAVFILFGQSNATGHDLPMDEKDIITAPLKNVYGLARTDNQSLSVSKLTWSHYTSGGMNLGETQDHTYSLANLLARAWQDKIDSGNNENLPDLYIVHISIGAQGVTKNYMWNPDYPLCLTPGPLGTANISLYPFAVKILSLLKESFEKIDTTPEIVGLHWRGGEEEMCVPYNEVNEVIDGIYEKIFNGFKSAVGIDCPIIIHKAVCFGRTKMNENPENAAKSLGRVNAAFDKMGNIIENCTVFDATKYPFYHQNDDSYGLFKDDYVHFTPDVNRWVANLILNGYINKK